MPNAAYTCKITIHSEAAAPITGITFPYGFDFTESTANVSEAAVTIVIAAATGSNAESLFQNRISTSVGKRKRFIININIQAR